MPSSKPSSRRSTSTAGAASWLVLVDFDGTITSRDADFEIADAILPPAKARAYEPLAAAYERLELGLVDYFRAYLDLLDVGPDEIRRHARDVALRAGVGELFASAKRFGAEVRVVSEGIDLYVEPALAAAGLGGVTVSCNRARRDNGAWSVLPAPGSEPCERCLNCKGVHVRRAQAEGRRVAIVGNGASDLCAARRAGPADCVIARDTLARHCVREGIRFHAWESFDDVVAVLRANLTTGR